MRCKIPPAIKIYIDLVRGGSFPVCRWQLLLCDLVERVFRTEDIRVDEAQLEKYLSYQKYFPFKLFEWEKFCFALHNCTYRQDGTLRFPILVLYVGRGTGKNGYLSFEDFCLLTPTNGVKEYHIDIFATSEDQAKMSWEDVYNILEDNKEKMKRHFKWNKEEIVNLKTGSKFRFRTSASKTKDGGRPGKVDFDELHAYEDYKLIDVATTGLGKKPFPRRTFMSTDGFVREGPLDKLIDKCEQILAGDIPDNGTLPFLCRLDDDAEVDTPVMWHKANPSLRYLPHTLQEIEQEYFDYTLNPTDNASFMVKRMNRPLKQMEGAIAPDDQIRATNQEIREELLIGRPCVAGVDYMLTTDFLGAGLLYRVNGRDYWITHTWVCRESPDLKRIKAPLDKWAERGLLTFVDAPQISPVLPAVWLATEAAKRQSVILKIGIDSFRYDLLKNALLEINFSADKEYGNVQLLRGSDEMRHVPSITSGFTSQTLIWGDNPLMRWAANNSKIIVNKQGNMIYGKIEPKSRKTDPFKAFVMAECVSDVLDPYESGAVSAPDGVDGVFVY